MSSRANSDPTPLSTLVRTHLERPFPTTFPLQSTTKTSIFCLPSTPHLFSRQALALQTCLLSRKKDRKEQTTDKQPQATKTDQHEKKKDKTQSSCFYPLTNKTKPTHLRENEKTRR